MSDAVAPLVGVVRPLIGSADIALATSHDCGVYFALSYDCRARISFRYLVRYIALAALSGRFSMFVKQIRTVLSSARHTGRAIADVVPCRRLPLNVRVGRALAVAAAFAAPALVTPANAGDLTIADPGNVCSWSLVGSTLTCTAAGPGYTRRAIGLLAHRVSVDDHDSRRTSRSPHPGSNADATTTWACSATRPSRGWLPHRPKAQVRRKLCKPVSAKNTTFKATATTGKPQYD